MSVRFTSGGAGKFTFDVANRLLDTADQLSGQPLPDDNGAAGRSRETIVARLLEKMSFTVQIAGQPLAVWSWSAYQHRKGASYDPNLRYLYPITNLNSDVFGGTPSGLAIQIGGGAAAGDMVILSPLPTYGLISGERWFAFDGNADPLEGGLSGAPTIGVAKIVSSSQIADRQWLYEIRLGTYRSSSTGPYFDSGNVVAQAYNLYEQSDMYGQNRGFVMGYLEVFAIPNGARVQVTYQFAVSGGLRFYVFTAPNPLRPVCQGQGMAQMQEAQSDRMLRDGI